MWVLPHLGADIIGLLDHFRIDKVNLVGHDWGAVVAWGVALTYPQRVRRLGILNVPHPVVMLRFLTQRPTQMLKSWYIGFFQIPGMAEWLIKQNNFASGAQMLQGTSQPGTFSKEDIAHYQKAWANAGGLTGMINWYRALVWHRPPNPANIRLQMPVLIQWGKKDAFLMHEMAEASLQLCNNGKLIYYDQATHWVQHEAATQVNHALVNFMLSKARNE